jgi:vacuolar-type H+-ATPase subunit F/Vma7
VLDAVRQVAGRAAVIAIQDGLWSSVPGPTRAEWLRQTDPLVVRIPDPDHGVAAAHQAELRDLLARAVGFQITFDSEGSS